MARADLLMREGRYPGRVPPRPFTPGWDVAGVVETAGPGVPFSRVGQRVVALSLTGGQASHVTVPSALAVLLPLGLAMHRAASIPLPYVTAHELLHHVAGVQPGERVLVRGESGAVGTAATALGTLAGAEMITEPQDADVVLDCIGGTTLRASWRALRPGGRLVSYGFLGGRSPIPDLLRLRWWRALPNGRSASFYRLSDAARSDPDRVRAALASVIGHLAAGRLETRIAAQVPLDDAAEAYRIADTAKGRVLLIP